MIDDDECGAVGGMGSGRGSRNILRKRAPVPRGLPQIPHDLTWARTRAAAVGTRFCSCVTPAVTDFASETYEHGVKYH
jgi:hypothetical protein